MLLPDIAFRQLDCVVLRDKWNSWNALLSGSRRHTLWDIGRIQHVNHRMTFCQNFTSVMS